MDRRFAEFRSVEADGDTAMLAIAEEGDHVLLSRDWGNLRERMEAEWERVVKALMPAAIEDIESAGDLVTLDVTVAVEHIVDSGLVDTTDSRGNRRARALLEYLIESRVFESTDDEVVLLESFGVDTESAYPSLLVTAAIFEYLQEELDRRMDELSEMDPETEETTALSHVIEEYTLTDSHAFNQELGETVAEMRQLQHAFKELEKEARQLAVQRQLTGDHMKILQEDITLTSLPEMDADEIDEQLSDLVDSGSKYPE